MALRRRLRGSTVAWMVLIAQLVLHAPIPYSLAFQLLASSTTTRTTTARHRRPAGLELGMILGEYNNAKSSSCFPTTRQRQSDKSRRRIRWIGITSDPDDRQQWAPLCLSKSSDDAADKDKTSEAVESKSGVEGEDAASSTAAAPTSSYDDDDVSSSGVTRTLLLAVPLFCKFVLVLMIKFVTDLIVYPLLLLYRSARIAKRKVLRVFYGDRNSSSNKSSRGGASKDGGASVNGAKP